MVGAGEGADDDDDVVGGAGLVEGAGDLGLRLKRRSNKRRLAGHEPTGLSTNACAQHRRRQ